MNTAELIYQESKGLPEFEAREVLDFIEFLKAKKKKVLVIEQETIEETWLDEIRWTADGLVPAIAQDAHSGKILMFAWMNRESLALTAQEGYAVYWSRSRNKLWRKGEESGHRQKIISIQLDCDEDVILLKIEQEGGIACHTGRESCFYRQLIDGQWQAVEPVLKSPDEIYKH